MNILNEILENKKREISTMNHFALDNKKYPKYDLLKALSTKNLSFIAEIKLKSPSEGDIFPEADIIQIAKDYQNAGASAISVLTDKKFFGGSLEFLSKVKTNVSIPVIQKDFIIDPFQVEIGMSHGADSFLLIAEAIPKGMIENFKKLISSRGLTPLIEFHSQSKIDIIEDLAPQIVGVNSRDLASMKTNIKHFEKVFEFLPLESIKVAESGIRSIEDLKYIRQLGYDAVLVGTSLMKSKSPGKALEKMIEGFI